ncbi:hypothetical protein, partial [Azoarcus sp. TTM-91]|uniref:hypothetical protein n=1 Tax=Azoarcus sp. TTM-91 TaxID=2691581 RepID=UPI001B7CE0A7
MQAQRRDRTAVIIPFIRPPRPAAGAAAQPPARAGKVTDCHNFEATRRVVCDQALDRRMQIPPAGTPPLPT